MWFLSFFCVRCSRSCSLTASPSSSASLRRGTSPLHSEENEKRAVLYNSILQGALEPASWWPLML